MTDHHHRRDARWLWQQIHAEGEQLVRSEPLLASFYHAHVLQHGSLASALAFQIASRLGDRDVLPMLLRQVCDEAYAAAPELVEQSAADCLAHFDRDPACQHYAMPLLYFKGFHAVQAYRVGHWLWQRQRRSLALFMQNRIAGVFDVDIHPAAQVGSGLMIDHGTGVVIGETAVLGDNISMLHSVTLGGCGTDPVRRHPRVHDGVLVAAGAKVLGPIDIGVGAKIAAGSVVLEDVPAHSTVAGVPARVVGKLHGAAPALNMDQHVDDV